MAALQRTFSESWYRIADKKLCLRPYAEAHRQYFRGQKWFVLRDPFNNQFFRLRPAAYEFVARLRQTRTVQEVWDECMEKFPDEAPGQEEVIQLLSQLYYANLLQYEESSDSAKLFERYKKRRERETRAKLLSIMFARFPLYDPDNMLKHFMPVTKFLISWFGAIVWLLVVGLAIKTGIENFDLLVEPIAKREQAEGILATGNLPLLYLSLVLIKVAHEFGHSFVCRRFGGEVHTMGVMLLVFTPLPYMDASSAWSFRNKWKRAFVGAAGMIVEVFFAALAMLFWAQTSEGVWHSLAYNIIFIASVSTVLFNANPLIRFDGYYILSDLIDIPNLHTQCARHLKHLVERYAFGYRDSYSPAQSAREYFWMTFFGIASWIYRIMVFAGILLFVAERFLLAGIIMFAICVVSWVIVPIIKFIKYLATSPHLDRSRPRAVFVTAVFVFALVSSFYWISFPEHFRAPGILQAARHTNVVTREAGFLNEFLVQPGDYVKKNTPLFTLRNKELTYQTKEVESQLKQAQAMLRKALAENVANVKSIEERIRAIREQKEDLLRRKGNLTVTARQAGRWVLPDHTQLKGTWVERGRPLGKIIDDSDLFFVAVVPQQEGSRAFNDEIGGASVRFPGDAEKQVGVDFVEVFEVSLDELPSAALGYLGGGEIPVDRESRTGKTTKEGYYKLRAHLDDDAGNHIDCFHGRSGKIRFELKPKPLLIQWYRKLRQMLQRRYGF